MAHQSRIHQAIAAQSQPADNPSKVRLSRTQCLCRDSALRRYVSSQRLLPIPNSGEPKASGSGGRGFQLPLWLLLAVPCLWSNGQCEPNPAHRPRSPKGSTAFGFPGCSGSLESQVQRRCPRYEALARRGDKRRLSLLPHSPSFSDFVP